MSKDKVSIIIPNFNCGKYIKQCIDSSINQSHNNVEIIVVDDGSIDNSKEILKSYGNLIRVEYQQNKGAPSARNKGLYLSEGDYIKFLDADDYLKEDIIEKQIEQACKLKKNEIPYGSHTIIYERNLRNNKHVSRPQTQSNESEISSLIDRNIMTTLPLYRRESLLEINGFDTNLTHSQEWNLNIKLGINGHRFIHHPITCYYQRIHGSETRISNKKKILENEISNLEITYNQIKHLETTDLHLKSAWARRIWAIARIFAAQGEKKEANLLFKLAYDYYNKSTYQFLNNSRLLFIEKKYPYYTNKLLNDLIKIKHFLF